MLNFEIIQKFSAIFKFDKMFLNSLQKFSKGNFRVAKVQYWFKNILETFARETWQPWLSNKFFKFVFDIKNN